MRVVVIGGGIAGLTLARELRRRGRDVELIQRDAPARAATWAAAGMLAPSSETETPGPLFELCRAAAAFYPDFIRELERETGATTEYRTDGSLFLYQTARQKAAAEKAFAWQRRAGVPIVHLDEQEVRLTEPAVHAAGAYLLLGDCQVDNRRLGAALANSCRTRGVSFRSGTVRRVTSNGGRAGGVALHEGTVLEADAVVNAAGAWAGQIEAPEAVAPVRPVKGQMLALATPGVPFTLVLHAPRVYLVPRASGRVIVGSTMEEAGFDTSVDQETIARLRHAAGVVAPRLRDAEVVETWAGLRPAFPDGLPRIGATSLPGYYLAAGYFRNGILLAPLAARLLAELICGAAPDPLLEMNR
jgi:glycine oxidase